VFVLLLEGFVRGVELLRQRRRDLAREELLAGIYDILARPSA